MLDTQTDLAEPAAAAPAPAAPPPRRGRVVAGGVTAGAIGFLGVMHAVGVEIPLLILGGAAGLFGLTWGARHVQRWLPKRRARRLRFSGSRPRRFGGGPGGRRGGLPKLGGGRRSAGRMAGRPVGRGLAGRSAGQVAGRRSKGLAPGRLPGLKGRGRAAPKGTATGRRGPLGRATGKGRTPGLSTGKRGARRSLGGGRGLPRRGGRPGQGSTPRRRSLGQRLRHPFGGKRPRTGPGTRVWGPGGPRGRRGISLRRIGQAIRRRRSQPRRPAGQRSRTGRVLGGIGAAFLLPFAALRALGKRHRRRKAMRGHGKAPTFMEPYEALGGNRKPSRLRRLLAWRPRRRKKQPQPRPQPAPEAPRTQQPPAEPAIQHAPTERLPKFKAPSGQNGAPQMSNAISAATEAIDQYVGGYQPEGATDLDLFLQDFPQLFEHLGQAIQTMASTLGEQFPVEPALPEKLREVGASVAGMADEAREAHGVHRNVHEAEINRIENPRPGEEMWDVTNQ